MPCFIKMLISSALDSTRVSILLSKYKRKRQSKAVFCVLNSEPTTKYEEWRFTLYFKTAKSRCIITYQQMLQ
jgi:aryl carrier-like protein